MRLQKFGADLVADFGDVSFRLEFCDFEHKLARERITVRMQTSRRKREKRVAGLNAFSSEKIFSLDRADDESRKIVFAGRIEAGQLRGFAADECAACFAASAAHAIHKLLHDVRVHFAKREIIEEKKWLRALDENVIHAMIDEIAPNSGVNVH